MVAWTRRSLAGWGRYPVLEAEVARPERVSELFEALAEGAREGAVLGRGLGRSYGDAAILEGGRVVLTERLDRLLAFDEATGWLRCEGGVSLEDILRVFVPRGWFPPVVPGTQFVTVGGAIAADIHGKNHHTDGTFADHVRSLVLLDAQGRRVVCSREENAALFWATVGGMGLTGLIVEAELQLRRIDNPWIEMESIRVRDLDHFLSVSGDSAGFQYTVGWIDCLARGRSLGRGIFMRGRHAPAGTKAPTRSAVLERVRERVAPLLRVPFDAPDWLLSTWSVRLFNEGYYRHLLGDHVVEVVHYEPFFFPLDAVRAWNRLYGRRGFLQYQFVLPPEPDHRTLRAILERIASSGFASFLAVIKEFGDIVHGGLSFPRPGVTVALDFATGGRPLFDMLDELDKVVADAGGRIYLAKDARTRPEVFRAMYPQWEAWRAVRDAWDPDGVFRSALGERLGLVPPRRKL